MAISSQSQELMFLLKVCASQKDLQRGSRLHSDIVNKGLLQRDIFFGNALVNMYAKCGAFGKAQSVLEQLPARNAVTWNTLIREYAQQGHHRDAFKCFEQMQRDGLSPNLVTYACILRACTSIGATDKGREIHADIVRQGFLDKSVELNNALEGMYAKCGALLKARELFEKLRLRDVITWNVLITGYARYNYGQEALGYFEQMRREGHSPDAVTFVFILKACGIIRAVDKGEEVHSELARQGLLEKDVSLGNALIDMYARCGALARAQEVFDGLPLRDVVTWNTLISAYTKHEQAKEALDCFEEMQKRGITPNAITFTCILKACSSLRAVTKGKAIHAEIIKEGLLETNMLVGTALVDMYAKCAMLEKAQEVFDRLRVKNEICFNALLTGYAQHGHGENVLNCFGQMQREGHSPNDVTFLCVLKACGSIGAIGEGREVHAEIVRGGWLERNSLLGTALVDMYAKCGALIKAQEVFNELKTRDVVAWNALIAGYVLYGYAEEAVACFDRMQSDGLTPSAATFVSVSRACGSLGAADKGKEIHFQMFRGGFPGDSLVGTALLDMYVKCGALERAQEVFNNLEVQDVVSWTLLISGYAQLGKDDIVYDSLCKMIGGGIEPNLITFSVILNSCCYTGELEKGQSYFAIMCREYGIFPNVEVYTCMVDLFGRAGHFDKAVSMLGRMLSVDFLPVWSAFLAACQKWGNVKLGRWAFEHAVLLDVKESASYVSMHNIYAAAAMGDDAAKIEAMRVKNQAWKNMPCFD